MIVQCQGPENVYILDIQFFLQHIGYVFAFLCKMVLLPPELWAHTAYTVHGAIIRDTSTLHVIMDYCANAHAQDGGT